MRKSLGSKRKALSPEHIEDITRLFGNFEESTRDGVPISRIFKNEDFGYLTITVERPQRDAEGKVVIGTKGKPSYLQGHSVVCARVLAIQGNSHD